MLPPRGLTALCTDLPLCTPLAGGDARRGGSRGDPAHAWVQRGPSGAWAALLLDPGCCWEAAPALRWGCVRHAALHAWKPTGSDPRRGRALPALPKPTPRTSGVSSRCHHPCDEPPPFPSTPPYSNPSNISLILQKKKTQPDLWISRCFRPTVAQVAGRGAPGRVTPLPAHVVGAAGGTSPRPRSSYL